MNQQSMSSKREVLVTPSVHLAAYRASCSPQEFETLITLARRFTGKSISFFNTTPQGGGVAIMRRALIGLFRLLGVDAHWYSLTPDPAVFTVTKKKFHNILQGVASQDVRLTEKDIQDYMQWIAENSRVLQHVFTSSHVNVIDDPQPSGLIPYIRKVNPNAVIFYRSHIHIEGKMTGKPGTPQHEVWQFLWDNIQVADGFISHPVPSFVPDTVPQEKIIYMPATADPLDGLNRVLDTHELQEKLDKFNASLIHDAQTPLDLNRDYFIQISRFDPSKGIFPDLLESFYTLRRLLKTHPIPPPQLVITGNDSVDDPEGLYVYMKTKRYLHRKKFSRLSNDIKVILLPHDDVLLNALLRRSKTALQLSKREGFEIKVTEALMKGVPVVAYKSGGIPLQIKDGVNGLLVKQGNTDAVAKHLLRLLTDEPYYQSVSTAAHEYYDKSLSTVSNAIRWLELGIHYLKEGSKNPHAIRSSKEDI